MLFYDPTGTILAILYREVPHMIPAKYQPNPPGGSGEEVIQMVFIIYGHGGHPMYGKFCVIFPTFTPPFKACL